MDMIGHQSESINAYAEFDGNQSKHQHAKRILQHIVEDEPALKAVGTEVIITLF